MSFVTWRFAQPRSDSPARKFALKRGRVAIFGDSWRRPNFRDISVSDNCKANFSSWTHFGTSYTKNSIDGRTVFTGSHNFQVNEIEVFAITI
jgi:hypothetical protein